jgi:hypothetical protein
VNAYVGFVVRRKGAPDTKGIVDEHGVTSALVWWGHRARQKRREDGQEWVRWDELEVVNPAGATITFSDEVRRRYR